MVVRFFETVAKKQEGSAAIVLTALLILLSTTILFVVSLADKEMREAYEKVNTVPVENAMFMGKD